MEINLRGDDISVIKMPLSCSHPLFNWIQLCDILDIIQPGKEIKQLIYTTS